MPATSPAVASPPAVPTASKPCDLNRHLRRATKGPPEVPTEDVVVSTAEPLAEEDDESYGRFNVAVLQYIRVSDFALIYYFQP